MNVYTYRKLPFDVTPWPEEQFLKDKPKTAISFSGGGSRAYNAALGVLAALTELGLMENVRYIGGISGGNWAMWNYVYSRGLADNDTQLLGPIIPPEAMTWENLNEMDPKCLRKFTDANVVSLIAGLLRSKEAATPTEAWQLAVQKVCHQLRLNALLYIKLMHNFRESHQQQLKLADICIKPSCLDFQFSFFHRDTY